MRHAIAATALLLVSLAPLRAEPHPLALQALENLEAIDEDAWSYTRMTTSREGTRVERHEAGRPEGERWTLLRVNGRAPTSKEIAEFRKEREKLRKARRERKGDDPDVDHSSIRLVSETAERATFSFRPKEGSGFEAKFAEQIAGTLVVQKDGAWAERFELRSRAPIAPVPGVKVSNFHLTMTFQKIAGEVLPSSIEISMRGRAFLVKSLDEDRTTRYSDFVRMRD